MQDRFQPLFSERIGQSNAAKLANLEAFRAALTPERQDNAESDSNTPEMPSVSKPLLRWVPKQFRTPLLAATAGVAALGAAACTSGGDNTEVPQAPTHQGGVLGEQVTPVPSASSESGQQNQPEQHKKAPDFTLNDRSGNPVSLQDFAGRLLVIQYSQSGCPPCRVVSTKVAELEKTYAGQGLSALNISKENDPNLNPKLRLLLDPDSKFAEAYVVSSGVPILIFIDREGNEVFRYLGGNQDNNDLGLLAAAFVAGKDLDGILPTATPAPTLTPLPTRAPESERTKSAEVIDLGNFDLGVTDWEEYTNVMPNTRASGLRTKHVVITAIARNKTEKWQEFKGMKPDFAEWGEVQLVGEDGEQLYYAPDAPIIADVITPLDYQGVFKHPFVHYSRDGTYRSVEYLYEPEYRPSKLLPPGFGIPVFIDFEIPVQVYDYNLKFEAYQPDGKKETKVIRKGQSADNFSLIAPNADISPPSESLDAYIKDVGDYSIKVLGSTKGNMVPGTALHDLLLFDVTNKMPLEKYPFGLSKGLVYLKDGRVVSLEKGNPKVGANTNNTVVGMYLGTADPHADFPYTPVEFIDKTFDFDLKGAVLVLGVLGQWKAWEIPEGTNVPVGQGGE